VFLIKKKKFIFNFFKENIDEKIIAQQEAIEKEV